MKKLAFLASHGGSAARFVAAACKRGELAAWPVLLISNNSGSAALAWAREEGLAALHLSARHHPSPAALDLAMRDALLASGAEVVLLSGYMKTLGPAVLEAYAGRVLNVHPSRLPAHGGVGMYGDRVHEAVLKAGASESGASVHIVTAGIDEGPVLAQSRVVVRASDTVPELRARVQATEGPLCLEALRKLL